MKKTQISPGIHHASARGPRFLRRLRDLLAGGFQPPQLVPVPIATGAGSGRAPLRPDPVELPLHRVFGRRRDEDKEQGASGPDEQAVPAADAEVQGQGISAEPPSGAEEGISQEYTEQVQPVPSALTDDERSELAPEPGLETSPVGSSWSSTAPDDPATEPSPFTFEPAADPQDLPAWTPSPLSQGGFPSFGATSGEEASPLSPWSSGVDPDPSPFGGVPSAEEAANDEPGGWPQAPEPVPYWASSGTPSSGDAGFGDAQYVEAEATDPAPSGDSEWARAPEDLDAPAEEAKTVAQAPDALDVVPEVDAPAESFESYDPDQVVEEPVVEVAETPFEISAPEPVTAPTPIYHVEEPARHVGAAALVADARAFPLPEGDVLFRNLRSGFTDPARLLRHLAGEGHTGVMHVASLDDRNSYIVLVDGYVVAVASDSQGRLTTTNRVSFPSFPNSQDILNVIIYPREIARGLGLLLHAPVHFRGLGAMFINMDGLRSYLSKHSASGGLVVQSDQGTGVALFDDGRLVGAYSGNAAPEADLAPLRDLIKDLDAEIDVRFGGPQSLDPIPLDTLLAGYPL